MNKILWPVLALLAGAVLPIQAGLNAKLGKTVGSPVQASLISFLVGTVALLMYVLISGQTLNVSSLKQVSAPVWLGGILGAFYVTVVILAFPRIGPALTFGLIVAGQMVVSLVLDHHNILVAQAHPINLWRVLGVVLIVAGVVIIRKF